MAPGPDVAMHAPIWPVNLACEHAMNAAISSCRVWVNVGPCSSTFSNAPRKALIPSPGIAVDAVDAPFTEPVEHVMGYVGHGTLLDR